MSKCVSCKNYKEFTLCLRCKWFYKNSTELEDLYKKGKKNIVGDTVYAIQMIKVLCEKQHKMDDEEISDYRTGYCGQWDDTFDAGIKHGKYKFAQEILKLIQEIKE